ncbi:MAG: hypothetical protein AAF618_06780 [Pseudomonadota bacterium]
MRAFLAAAAFALATPVAADPLERLMTALHIEEVVDILAIEGLESAAGLEDSMFPGRGGPAWEAELARIYDREAMADSLSRLMGEAIPEDDLTPILAFLESEQGARIMSLEISARRAFVDPSMEEAALEAFADAEETRPELFEGVAAFTEVNQLVEQNIEGAFRSNAAFALGLKSTGAFPRVTAEQLTAELWGGDEAVEAGIRDWLYAYLMTAYSPLPADDLDAYIAFSETEAGQVLNTAIMETFAAHFADTSFDLGAAAGRFMAQQEL